MIQIFNMSAWGWFWVSPAERTRDYFRDWNKQTRAEHQARDELASRD